MIESTYKEAFSPEWVRINIKCTNELAILRKIIPWQKIIGDLTQYYSKNAGAIGISLRTMVAILVICRFRQLSDRRVILELHENRYIQYFCNISNVDAFMDHTSIHNFRKRIGDKGISSIEDRIFNHLRIAGVIKGEDILMDSTVLSSNIIYPNDVHLIYNAFEKFAQFCHINKIEIWFDNDLIKILWRKFNLDKEKSKNRQTWLQQFYDLFVPAFKIFKEKVEQATSKKRKEKARDLLNILNILDQQTVQKLAGVKHIENRLVSLKEVDARPIKKGKTHPDCEFGTTLQMTFNRDGFLITTENFIGVPGDKTLYRNTLELYINRICETPKIVVTDLGYRSTKNLGIKIEGLEHVFMGKSSDVDEDKRDFCGRARSATEGFIAVAKNIRGFGRSLYVGLQGDRIWTLLCQIGCNLKKFLQLYSKDEIKEESLMKLGLLV